MFRDHSWIQRAAVVVLLLGTLCAVTIAPPHPEAADDFACSPIPVAHDESAHYIGARQTPAHSDADHCFLCHSFRSFHPPLDTFEGRHDVLHSVRLHIAQAGAPGCLEWSLVPGRAPPA